MHPNGPAEASEVVAKTGEHQHRVRHRHSRRCTRQAVLTTGYPIDVQPPCVVHTAKATTDTTAAMLMITSIWAYMQARNTQELPRAAASFGAHNPTHSADVVQAGMCMIMSGLRATCCASRCKDSSVCVLELPLPVDDRGAAGVNNLERHVAEVLRIDELGGTQASPQAEVPRPRCPGSRGTRGIERDAPHPRAHMQSRLRGAPKARLGS
jgi:hypothetical protein